MKLTCNSLEDFMVEVNDRNIDKAYLCTGNRAGEINGVEHYLVLVIAQAIDKDVLIEYTYEVDLVPKTEVEQAIKKAEEYKVQVRERLHSLKLIDALVT